ncbi:MAG: proline iminopeptidase [Hyphococcus sp.]|nr:MAG: proline iminopeptidase [Marinicaulis sp.]
MIDPEYAGYLSVDGGKVWYRENGSQFRDSEKSALIVLHGGPGGSHRRPLPITALSDERRVIFYDQLDCGNSERPGDKKNWTIERYVSEIDSVVKALNVTNYVLLGHSAGASWTIPHAAKNPRGLTGLILSSPLVSTKIWLEDSQRLISTLENNVRDEMFHAIENMSFESAEFKKANEVFEKIYYCRTELSSPEVMIDAPPFNFELYNYMWGPSEFHGTGTLKELDLSNYLPEIATPTLFVCGEYDLATPSACENFSKLVENAETRVVSDAAHCAYLERPDEYLGYLRHFLNGQDR